jgi:hypothetical protein
VKLALSRIAGVFGPWPMRPHVENNRAWGIKHTSARRQSQFQEVLQLIPGTFSTACQSEKTRFAP